MNVQNVSVVELWCVLVVSVTAAAQDSKMVTTTQIATCPECKSKTGCKDDCKCKQGKRILVDYK